MAQIECGRGHLYDPDKYPACPYCNGGQRISVTAASRTAPINLGGGQVPVGMQQRTAPVQVTAQQKTAPLSPTPVTASQKTAPLSGMSVTAPQKTMPPRGYGGVSVTAANKTVGMMQEKIGFDPVVGWLACIEGPSRGKSYTIRGGINSVGRSERMDIVITGDNTISSENHVKVSYSDRNNRFNIIPGDGRNIVYLNGEEVFSSMPLNAYDIIDCGETKLMFVPLCGEIFQWKKEGTD
ncbi:MAG: FHA domain-containing protein [Firmicutes bacterium]|nr:FHA domain-containing protein [Bacillota bacterium]